MFSKKVRGGRSKGTSLSEHLLIRHVNTEGLSTSSDWSLFRHRINQLEMGRMWVLVDSRQETRTTCAVAVVPRAMAFYNATKMNE